MTREQMPSKKLLIGNDRLDIKMLANDKLEASNLLLYYKVWTILLVWPYLSNY